MFGRRSIVDQVFNGLSDQSRVYVTRGRVHVHEDGDTALEEDAVGRGDEGEGSGDDQVAFLNPGRDDGQVQTTGAGIDSHGIPRTDGGSKGFLKRFDLRAEAEVAGLQDFVDRRDVGIGEVG